MQCLMYLVYIKVQSSKPNLKSEALFANGLDHCAAVSQALGMTEPSLGGNVKHCQKMSKNVQKRFDQY